MKPRLSPMRRPDRPGKWKCVTQEVSAMGHRFEAIGTGYTPADAYRKWQRASKPATSKARQARA